ncbi:EXPERA domain-containing protein [Balamuthia mandrillaris]
MEAKPFLSFRSPAELLKDEPTYLALELVLYTMCAFTFAHAWRQRKTSPHLLLAWVSTIGHGFTTELVSYFLPDIDNFWHGHSMISLFRTRFPLHIVCFYPCVIYVAYAAAERLNFRWWAVPFAVGLLDVIIDVPFDILGIKFLWWTWHDTDPNVFDRHYYVPWTSYIFHMTFACSFTFLFNANSKAIKNGKKDASFFSRYLRPVLVTGVFTFPMGVSQFLPFYHLLHDGLSLHTEVCFFVLFLVYALIFWTEDRRAAALSNGQPKKNNKKYSKKAPKQWYKKKELWWALLVHYTFYMVLVLVADPSQVRATGLHQGMTRSLTKCESSKDDVFTAFGQHLYRNTYLCLDHYDEDVSLRCPQSAGSEAHNISDWPQWNDNDEHIYRWYTLCGTAYSNWAEYTVIIWAFCILGLVLYSNILLRPRRRSTSPTKHGKAE